MTLTSQLPSSLRDDIFGFLAGELDSALVCVEDAAAEVIHWTLTGSDLAKLKTASLFHLKMIQRCHLISLYFLFMKLRNLFSFFHRALILLILHELLHFCKPILTFRNVLFSRWFRNFVYTK